MESGRSLARQERRCKQGIEGPQSVLEKGLGMNYGFCGAGFWICSLASLSGGGMCISSPLSLSCYTLYRLWILSLALMVSREGLVSSVGESVS